jgi:hypothetical protein
MKIYTDSQCRCHTTNPEGSFREFEVPFFDGKCDAFIEGYHFVPSGESWTRSDGVVFQGEMIAPWKDYSELDSAQRKYERQLITEYEALINELYSEVTA